MGRVVGWVVGGTTEKGGREGGWVGEREGRRGEG